MAPPYVSLNCFYSIWQRDYGHIKVSKPSEDICNLCVAFANRHKYQLSEEANSSADGELFIQQTSHLTDFDFDDEWEEEDWASSGQPKEKSTLESTKQTPWEKSKVDELMEDEGAAADDPALERREQMIYRADKHVEMARAQQIKYTILINKARQDSLDSVVHSKRTYTFVFDYGQNMEVPVLNEAQFGASYHYTVL
jgi:hypothetical protein